MIRDHLFGLVPLDLANPVNILPFPLAILTADGGTVSLLGSSDSLGKSSGV